MIQLSTFSFQVTMNRLIVVFGVAVAAILMASAAPTADWRSRADAIGDRVTVWSRNNTGSNNGNENLAGKIASPHLFFSAAIFSCVKKRKLGARMTCFLITHFPIYTFGFAKGIGRHEWLQAVNCIRNPVTSL